MSLFIGVLCGLIAMVLLLAVTHDMLVCVYRLGYEHGRKDACDWWTQVAKDVEQMGQHIKDEERWP